jgi:hypothetical protein
MNEIQENNNVIKPPHKKTFLAVNQDAILTELINDLMDTKEFMNKSHLVRCAIVRLHRDVVIKGRVGVIVEKES